MEKEKVIKSKKKIPTIVDIRSFILLPPEINRKEILEFAEKEGFKINNPLKSESGIYTLDAFDVPAEMVPGTFDKLNKIKDTIKLKILEHYNEESLDILQLDSRMKNLISIFIAKSIEIKVDVDSEELNLVLSSILGNLYISERDKIRFVDEKTIQNLVNFAMSTDKNKSNETILAVMADIAKQLRRLTILWAFETISLNFYNFKGKDTLFSDHTNEIVEIRGMPHKIVPINIQETKKGRISNRKVLLAYSEIEYSLNTINIGREFQDVLIPVIASMFVDKQILKTRINYLNILIESILRLLKQAKHQISNLDADCGQIEIKDLETTRDYIKDSLEILYQTLFNLHNQLKVENRNLKKYYMVEYSRAMKRIFAGAISEAIKEETPLDLLEVTDQLLDNLDKTLEDLENFKNDSVTNINFLIEAKKLENPALYKKMLNGLQEYSVKFFAELGKRLIKD